jgi:hypothetical protein
VILAGLTAISFRLVRIGPARLRVPMQLVVAELGQYATGPLLRPGDEQVAAHGRPHLLPQPPDAALAEERRQGLGRQLAVPAGLHAGPQEQGQLALGERGRGVLAGAAGPPAGPVPNVQRAM